MQTFTNALKNRHMRIGLPSPKLIPVTIRACTVEANSVGYLQNIDNDPSLFVDVCDDFYAECSEIQSKLGRDFAFTMGDYCLVWNCGY